MSPSSPDVRVANHGSLFGFELLSEAAERWVGDNLPEDTHRLGNAVYVEPRCARDIALGMSDEGLVVE